MDAETFTMRATPALKAKIRRLQGQLQASRGRKVTVAEAVDFAFASVEAQWPTGTEPIPDGIVQRLSVASIETNRPEPLAAAAPNVGRKRGAMPPE